MSLFFDDGRHPQPPHRAQRVVGDDHHEIGQHAEILFARVDGHPRREGTARWDALSGDERRGDPAVGFDGAHDQFGTARIRERKGTFLPGGTMLYRAKFNNIFDYLRFRGVLSSGTRLRPVDADAVGDDRRAVGAAVDAYLEGVAQRAVAGIGLGDEVGNVDRSLFARCDLARGGHRQQPARFQRAQFEPDGFARGVCIADGGLYLLPGADVGEGVEGRGEPQPSARIDRVELLGGFHARRDIAPDGERGDLFPLGGVDAQFLGEGAGAVGRVECHLDGGFLAGADRTLGELGYRAAAGGDHVEDHYGRIAAVLAREGMAHTAVGFADRAEIPGVGGKDQLCLRRRCESAKSQECEEDMSSCRHGADWCL